MTSPQPTSHPEPKREVRVGDQECPRCKESFTISYLTAADPGRTSCEMKWPRTFVV